MKLPSPTAPGWEIMSLSGAFYPPHAHKFPPQPPKTHTFTHKLNECPGRQKHTHTHTRRQVCFELVLTLPRIPFPSQKHWAYCRYPRSPKAERTRTKMERKHRAWWDTRGEWWSSEDREIKSRKAPWRLWKTRFSESSVGSSFMSSFWSEPARHGGL